MSGGEGLFKTFPEFSKLTMADKTAYETLIATYPPISDISFPSLLCWWNELDSCAVSLLHGNLVISYWLPGDEKDSGLCLLGTKKLDESVCEIFDYLRDEHRAPRLVHVPEFVVTSLKYPEMFTFIQEQDQNEVVYAVNDMYPLDLTKGLLHRRVAKFLDRQAGLAIELRSLDLRQAANRQLIIDKAAQWDRPGSINNIADLDRDALRIAATNAPAFGIGNLCVYIDDRLVGYQLYQRTTNDAYIIGTFIKHDPTISHLTEYMFHAFASWLHEQGIQYINFEQDLGLAHLRAQKLALRPADFFRKYTIEPTGK